MLTPARKLFRWAGRESGQSTVEFGVIVPLVTGLILALVGVGIGVNDAIDATHLANEGARLAAVNADVASLSGGAYGTLEDYIKGQASTKDLKDATVTICAPDGTEIGDPVRVVVSSTFDIVPFIDASFPLRGSSSMRMEVKPTHYTPSASC